MGGIDGCILLLNVLLVLSDAVQVQQGSEAICDSAHRCTHIFACPEALLHSSKWRKLLLDSKYVNSLVVLVIDEGHCIIKW